MSPLVLKQIRFATKMAMLVQWVNTELPGYYVTLAEAYRPGDPRCHGKRLAQDLNLFIEGVYQRETEAYLPLGLKWESMDDDARWGGRFKDGNHFSFEHGGYK